ncbi:MAG: DNA gyrase subunit A [Deltaproteobacteria bacterium]|nr:MAG: DNA gyrase subunit A [Deltaproteobacteria bacterium]
MDFAKDVVPIRIEDEMRNSYMDYSMSVIIGRALPDVRDGLKPVHRRILYAMDREGLAANKKYSKCAGVVGEVLKKYHPHGDSAVYDALVRMAQPWNLRYMLVDGQGNFGSVDGDPAAAYRYTECRMTRLAEEMLTDIDKETVSFSPNFDGQVLEPDVLPARFPNLLVNGADGIAVGMATKIPPHNLVEVINACVHLIENPDADLDDLMELIPGPDFPTGGTIYGRKGVRDAYSTGRGRVVVRGRAEFEELKNGRTAIIIDELPYQVNKARLIQQIAELVKDKRIDGIHALRDESDRKGMRVVIELKNDAFPEVVLNHLYKHTPLQSTFGVILLAIVNKRPRVLTLREMISHYISHRRDVILRRTRYLLRKAKERAHILEGFKIALDWLDEVIALIRASANAQEAREGLMARFDLTEIQASAILEMRLQRLTGMEREKILEELQDVLAQISEYEDILGSEIRLMGVVKDELVEVRDQYGDDRRTRIVDDLGELSIHDLVAEEDHVVTVSHLGYIKRVHPDEWRAQKRGGMGKKGMATRDEDYVTSIFIANTHNTLMVFTSSGKVYPLPVYQIPETSRTAKGKPIINLVPVQKDEKITAVVSVPEISDESGSDLLFVSHQGLVKRTALSEYRNIRQGGLIACGVAEDDELQIVKEIPADAEVDVMIFSAKGQSIRFKRESDEGKSNGVPSYGRNARGNKGIALDPGDFVVEALLVPAATDEDVEDEEIEEVEVEGEEAEVEAAEGASLLTVTTLGYGKRTVFDQWRRQNRNGKGIIGHKLSDKTGDVAGALVVEPGDHLMIVTDTGRIIRFEADSVSTYSRSTQGVRLMRLEDDERIVDVTRIVEEEDEDLDDEEGAEAEGVADELSEDEAPTVVDEE